MLELLVFAAALFAIVLVIGVLGTILGAVLWLVFLPFQLLGWAFELAGWVLAAPFVFLAALIALVVLTGVLFAFALPLLPFLAVGLFVLWLARRGRATPRTA
ncbi:MAG: hypothetical protein HOP12_15580 [Candidatus Eisenbacteria bacterium]|uniref:Uncharacterized protein n=1 Tax=Eiseniibacteriota bacterium TaxID=2212470 RepID=A0A849STX5_UNCEI|nr:hypothetical protein [Candidatus Eisenbacteria bacterium]